MSRKVLRTGRTTVTALCLLVVCAFVAAQTLPVLRRAALSDARDAQTPGPTPQPTPATERRGDELPPQSRRRNLSRYDQGGTLRLDPEASRQEREAALGPARAFLLGHWRERRLGHLSVSAPGPDGRASVSAFYVEPDERGRWCVVLETTGGAETFRVVEEVELSEDGPPALGGGTERRPAGRGLHLKQDEESRSGLVL